VAADVRAVVDERRVDVEAVVERKARADGAEAIAAESEDAAEEEAGEERHAVGVGARHETSLGVHLDHQLGGELVVEAPDYPVTDELVVAAGLGEGDLGRALEVDAVGGEEAIVAGVVGERRADGGGEAVAEDVREGQLLED